jgi:hypothetical protein
MTSRAEVTTRYARARCEGLEEGQGHILDQVVEVIGWSRDNARRRLSAAAKRPPAPGRSVAERPCQPTAAAGDEALHPDPQADDPARLLVWDVRIGEHIKDLVEQPPAVYLGLGAINEPLRNFMPSTGIPAGQRLVELVTFAVPLLPGVRMARSAHRSAVWS